METLSALLAICAGIHRSPVNSPHKGHWRGALMFSFICAWTNSWVNNGDTGDLRRQRSHYEVIVMAPIIKRWPDTAGIPGLVGTWTMWMKILINCLVKLILVIGSWDIAQGIALRQKSLRLTDDKPTLVLAMAWYRQATYHYLSQDYVTI